MIAWACTLKQLRERIDAMIKVMGEDAPVGTTVHREETIITDGISEGGVPCPAGEFMNECGVQIEYVFIDLTGRVVGDEANDYKMKKKEQPAVKIS